MLLVLFALAAPMVASPHDSPQTTFPAETEVVRLDVVVTDSAGRPLRDLRREDFEVREDGTPQRVLHFRHVSTPHGALASAAAGETTTAIEGGAVEPRLVRRLVFAIDDLHLSASHLLVARRDVGRFVSDELEPEDEVALVTTSGVLGVRQRFTRDHGAILRALERVGVQDRSARFRQGEKPYISEAQAEQIGNGVIADGTPTNNEAFELAVAQFRDEFVVDRATAERMTLERVREILAEGAQYTLSVCTTLEDVIRSLGALPGRKAIVLLSDGFHLGTGTLYQSSYDVRRLTDAATRSGVVVHAIDVGGLRVPTPGGDISERSAARSERRQETPGFVLRERVEMFADASRREGMKRVADETGGLAVFDNNDLAFGLRRVRDDGDDYYLLAYEPSHTAHDGRFRALSVRVVGRRGKLAVRTRRGYFAPRDSSKPPAPGAGKGETDDELRSALESVAPLPGLAVDVRADAVGPAEEGPAALVRTRVATAAQHLDLAYRIVDGAGAVAAQGSERVELAGEGAPKGEIAHEKSFPLRPGRYEIVVVARGDGSGKVGSGFATVEIPDATGRGVTLSEPAAGAVEPLRVALAAREPRQDFVHQAGALHFAAKEGERESVVLVEVPLEEVKLTPDEPSQRYRAHLTLLALVKDATGELVTSLSHDWPLEGPLDEIEARRRGRATFRHTLRLPPGRYVLETAVQDRQSDRLSVERTPFEVPAAGPGIALSSLAIVRRTDVGVAASQGDPLRVGRVWIAPELGTKVVAGRSPELTYFMTVYPAAGPEPVEIGLEFRREGTVVARTAPALPAPEPDGRIPFIGRAPLGALGPGVYEVVAAARQGAAVAEERASFEIPPTPSPVLVSPRAGIVAPEIADVLEKAARYVIEYETTFRNLVAEEDYRQEYLPGGLSSGAPGAEPSGGLSSPKNKWASEVRTRADLVFARLPGDTWGSFRDVFEVDGQKVRDPDARLEKLFGTSPASAPERARYILQESARYNIGGIRNINIPTLPLQFLRPKTAVGFSFKRGGHRLFAGIDAMEVRFTETARPTFVKDGPSHRNLPAEGSFWIDPERGTILRSETRFNFDQGHGTATISTQYRFEPGLAMWVPAEMTERYEGLRGQGPSEARSSITTGIARYSNFRRFNVTTEEKAALPTP